MDTVIGWVLGIATVIGGIAAIGYFLDKWRAKVQWVEKEKEVNSEWWESSGLKKQYEEEGCRDFGWSNPDRVAELLSAGMEVVHDPDEKNKVRYKLVNKSRQVLLCRRGS